jgi:cystathionine gamma-synthase
MDYNIETRCIHGENVEKNHPYGAITVPIYQTATFSHPGIGETTGHNYTRESNPTRDELEHIISSLEGAIDTVACSSGMAAIRLCMELFDLGDHIICTDDLYGGSVRIFESVGKTHGLEFSYVDTSDIAQVEAAIKENTAAFYIETPSNPTMKVTDLEAIVKLAKKHNIYVAVDNTFLSPYFQNPLKLGADAVIHSGTKFLGGHNDTLAGFFSTNNKYVADKLRFLYKTTGSNLSPFDSFMLIRGIKTLAVRMEKQQENAIKIANWLKEQKKITDVYYIGLPEHPGYEINKKQSRGFGSMISFRTDTGETAKKVLEKLKLIAFAESLGGVESLITYPMIQTHGDVPVKERERLGITENFLRMSVGIENADDLIADLKQALED